MKTRVPLYAFMPYGAPELIEAERAHMLRALLAASLLVPALLLGAFTLAARFATPVLTTATIVFPPGPDLLPPPSIAPPAPPTVPIARPPAVATSGEVVPVSDERADPTATLPSQSELNDAHPGVTDAPQGGTGSVAPPAQVRPEPDQWVYVEDLPVLAHAATPTYPEIAKEAGVEGTVRVLALVGLDGRVIDTRIAPNGSVPMLDDAAREALMRFVFTPALANGHPVMVWVSVPVVFRLH